MEDRFPGLVPILSIVFIHVKDLRGSRRNAKTAVPRGPSICCIRPLPFALVFLVAATLLVAGTKTPKTPGAPHARPTVLAFTLGDRTALRSLSEHATNLDLLSPQAFQAHSDGRLTGRIPADVAAAAAQGHLPMMPAVVNAEFSVEALSTLLESRASRARIAAALVTAAARQHLRGFVIDFEGLSRAERQHYALFLEEARVRFHKAGLRLGVAVPAPVGSFREAFDFAAVGRAADIVVLMAYDQHSRGSAPGPIAGYNWVERVVADTVAAIPAAKVLLGLPLYHRSWTESPGFRDSTAGSHRQALSLLNESGGALQWDPLSRSPWFRIENLGTEADSSGDGGATHTVWLENSRSVAEKIELARRYKLAGVAAWRLGQEDPGVWGVFENYRGAIKAPAIRPRHRRAATQSRAALARR
jgi:spore germination protein YaaH